MPADIEFKLEGIEELITKNGRLVQEFGPIVQDMMKKSVSNIEKKAKDFVPVDTGRLKSSITHEIGPGNIPMWAQTGTNVIYARPMEYGTKAFFPPWGAKNPGLEKWAKAHGIQSGFLVARGISRHGLRARRYMQHAFEYSMGAIEDFIEEAKRKIEGTWA